MPTYEFKCPECGAVRTEYLHHTAAESADRSLCPHKDENGRTYFVRMKRIYSFATTGMPTQAGRKMGRK